MHLFFIFILGLCVGSFLNVLIDRLPKNESIVKGRSHCDHCRHKLHWYDLIPVVSFILLNSKCRYCRSPISIQYPIVELLTGILFIFTFFYLQSVNFQFSPLRPAALGFDGQAIFSGFTLIYYLMIISSLIVIFFTDLKYGIIPDKVIYSSIFITILFLIFNFPLSTFNSILSAFFVFAFFFLIFLITRGKGMGFGDVKLVFLLGLMLGFPEIVVALYIAFLLGAVIAIMLILIKKKKFFGDTIPFGPFLVFGTFIALFVGDFIINNYMSFLIW